LRGILFLFLSFAFLFSWVPHCYLFTLRSLSLYIYSFPSLPQLNLLLYLTKNLILWTRGTNYFSPSSLFCFCRDSSEAQSHSHCCVAFFRIYFYCLWTLNIIHQYLVVIVIMILVRPAVKGGDESTKSEKVKWEEKIWTKVETQRRRCLDFQTPKDTLTNNNLSLNLLLLGDATSLLSVLVILSPLIFLFILAFPSPILLIITPNQTNQSLNSMCSKYRFQWE